MKLFISVNREVAKSLFLFVTLDIVDQNNSSLHRGDRSSTLSTSEKDEQSTLSVNSIL